jgi:hypothetical protein
LRRGVLPQGFASGAAPPDLAYTVTTVSSDAAGLTDIAIDRDANVLYVSNDRNSVFRLNGSAPQLSSIFSDDAALTIGTMIGNTVLVMSCVVVAFIMMHLKPLLHPRCKALKGRMEATKHSISSAVHCAPTFLLYLVKAGLCVLRTLPSDSFPGSMYTS